MDTQRMVDLANELAVAKSRQDVPAALALLHPDMVLESPAFGTRARGPAENGRALTRFFASFPDYDAADPAAPSPVSAGKGAGACRPTRG